MRLLVVGIRPRSSSVQPSGNHLRWTLPATRGFPEKGFRVWRKVSGFKSVELKLPKIDKPERTRIDAEGFLAIRQPETVIQITDDGHWQIAALAGQRLLIRFSEPAVHAVLVYSQATDSNTLTAFRGRLTMASVSREQSGGSQTLAISGSYFDHILLTLNFGRLLGLRIVTERTYLASQDWKPVANLPLLLPGDSSNSLARFEPDLDNRYARSRDQAIDRYDPEIHSLLNEQQLLLEDVADRPLSPASVAVDDPLMQPISARSALSMAASDPNIARLLSLYWVDRDKGGHPPARDRPHDYKIEALYRTGVVAGLALVIGAEEAELPAAPAPAGGEQLPGLAWKERMPLGQVGLRWGDLAPSWSPARTVLVDVFRQSEAHNRPRLLTEQTPVALARAPEDQPMPRRFTDRLLPLGKHQYRLRGIDLFGQVGSDSPPITVEVQDLAAPPPPVRLRAAVHQPGFPWSDPETLDGLDQTALDHGKVTLAFEYGEGQHLQAPDARSVRLYWRRNRLRDRIRGKVKAIESLSSGDGASLQRFRLRIEGLSVAAGFVDGMLARVAHQAVPLGNADRLTGRIEKADGDWLQVTLPRSLAIGDEVELTSDPSHRPNWLPFGKDIALREPLGAEVKAITTPVLKVRDVLQTEPLALQQGQEVAEAIPARFRPPAASAPSRELVIDRDLLEPNLFAMAAATPLVGGDSATVLYSTPGHGFGDGPNETSARLGISSEQRIDAGDRLALTGPLYGEDHVGDPIRHHSMDVRLNLPPRAFDGLPSGGEIAFLFTLAGEPTRVIGRVVSSPIKADGDTLLMVKFRLADWLQHEQALMTARALYYAPYLLDAKIDVAIRKAEDGFPDDQPAWEWLSDQGVFPGFIALAAIDDRDAIGPLSKPVEVSAMRPPPLGRPPAPRPCDMADADLAAAGRGQATPPDLDGRATVCLEWTPLGITPSEGLRCEMARALDVTIIETDRKAWLQDRAAAGLPPDHAASVMPGRRFSGLSVLQDPAPAVTESGLVAMATALDGDGQLADPALRSTLAGGRLITEPLIAGQPRRHAFKITKLQPLPGDGGSAPIIGIRWLLQPMARGRTAVAGSVEVEAPPDYRRTLADDQALAALANKPSNQDAFGIVTGNPLDAESGDSFRFTDDLPGLGANRYLYKARAVDAAGNPSRWSPASVPVYQTDTRPPAAPEIVKVRPLPGAVALHLRRPATAAPERYRLHRAANLDALDTAAPLTDYHGPGSGVSPAFQTAPLRNGLGTVDLGARTDLLPDLAIGGSTGDRLTAVRRTDDSATPPLNYLVTAATAFDGNAVIGLNPFLAEGEAVALALADETGWIEVLYRNAAGDGPLTLNQGRLDFAYPFAITEIVGVYHLHSFTAAEPLDGQSARNLFLGTSSFDPETGRIAGLEPESLADQRPVVVVARRQQPDGSTVVAKIDQRFGSLDVLRCRGDGEGGFGIDLHLAIDPVRVAGVFRTKDYDHGRSPGEQTAADCRIDRPTAINLDRNLVTGLNPLLADGSALSLKLVIDGADVVIDHRLDEVILLDQDVPVLPPGATHAYGLAAVREIDLGDGPPLAVAGPMTKVQARALKQND